MPEWSFSLMHGLPLLPWSDGFLLSLSLCLDIGIVNTAILTLVLSRGFRQGMLLGLGSCFGDLFYAVLALLGMTALLQFEAVKWVVWIGGSAVLLTFAYRTAREGLRPLQPVGRPDSGSASRAAGNTQTFARGFLLAVSSPTALLWFAAAGGALIAKSGAANSANVLAAPAFLGGFFLGGVSWTFALCGVASRGGKRLGQGMMLRTCHLASAVLFTYFACSVVLSGYRELIQHRAGAPHAESRLE
jgi:L-lysine exporter family protein LysE/ArgO